MTPEQAASFEKQVQLQIDKMSYEELLNYYAMIKEKADITIKVIEDSLMLRTDRD